VVTTVNTTDRIFKDFIVTETFQELVQNADDANATVMKVLYDGRTINSEEKNESPYRKFLRVSAFYSYWWLGDSI
jgi:hypothetical protein